MSLLPCPFCGSDNLKIDSGIVYVAVVCLNPSCMACGPQELDSERAVEAWNIRIDDEQ